MKRRDFICAAAAAGLFPMQALGQSAAPRFADMHAHLGVPRGPASLREAMAKGGMLLVAEKVIPDSPLLRLSEGRLRNLREAKPGELRGNFEVGLERRKTRMKAEQLPEAATVAALDQALNSRNPAIVLAAEGADFLDGDIGYVEKIRAQGVVHLQLVHYYAQSLIGDISTEEPRHGGLTAFGRDLVRACNRLGMLVDVAHFSNAAIDQVLELSAQPVVYSHGHVSAGLPHPAQGGIAARAIHAPVAKRLAQRGGVVGLWPNWYSYANLDLYADALARAVEALGAEHVGIGSDLFGLVRTVMPGYEEFAALPDYLAKRGLKGGEVESVLGGNYIRVLRQALTV